MGGDIRSLVQHIRPDFANTKRPSSKTVDLYAQGQLVLAAKVEDFNNRMCGDKPIIAPEETLDPQIADLLDINDGIDDEADLDWETFKAFEALAEGFDELPTTLDRIGRSRPTTRFLKRLVVTPPHCHLKLSLPL